MGQAWSLPDGLRRGPQLGKEQQLQAATWARADIPARNNAVASQGRAIGDTCRQMERETRIRAGATGSAISTYTPAATR